MVLNVRSAKVFPSSNSYTVALKLCKQYQLVGIGGVSRMSGGIFHRLIHTCVENFMRQKYFLLRSA